VRPRGRTVPADQSCGEPVLRESLGVRPCVGR
jgi:hypothetical protein